MSALEEYRKLADDRQWLIIDDIFDKADAAIAELEALVNANTDHMTEVGVELCRERDARISELEAENADLRGLLLVIGSSHPHLVPHIDTYLKARAKGGSGTLYPRSG